MSKDRRIYILIAIAIPFAIAGFTSALLESYLRPHVILLGIGAIAWGIGLYNEAKKIAKSQKTDKPRRASKINHRRKRMIFLIDRTLSLLFLVTGIAYLLISVFVWDLHVYMVFNAIFIMVLSGGHSFFIGPLTGD